MKTKLTSLIVLLSALLLVSCEKESAPVYDVALKDSTLGKILTDSDGKTLYFFSNDIVGGSQCTGACLTNWPVFYKPTLKLNSDLNASDFATITRSDGSMQTTYKGWPLYYFSGDVTNGEMKGENVNKVWFVAKPSYSLFVGNAQLVGHDGKNYTADYKEGTGKTPFLIDNKGRTLYGYIFDKNKANKFTKSDFSNDAVWPIAQITDFSDLPSGFAAADFSVIDVFGKKQLTYKGWPLYYFGQDTEAKGATKGVSFPRAGVWPIINSNTAALP